MFEDNLTEEIKVETTQEEPKVEVEQEVQNAEEHKIELPKEVEKVSENTDVKNFGDIVFGVKADKNIHFEMDKDKSVKEQAKDLVELAATANAVKDEQLVDDITKLKKEELKTGAATSLKEETVKAQETEKNLQKANYGVYEGIADLIGLKKPLPNVMLKILMIILTPVLILYYLVFGLAAGMINIIMDCINAVVGRFAEFTKPARKIILFVLITAVVVALLLVIKFLLNKFGIINW